MGTKIRLLLIGTMNGRTNGYLISNSFYPDQLNEQVVSVCLMANKVKNRNL